MATEVLMPKQGNTVESCIILSWKKQEGEAVKEGEVLCEVETDKATFEVEAPGAGTLLNVLHAEGEDVPVLDLIAVIGEPGEDVSELLREKGPAASGSPASAMGTVSDAGTSEDGKRAAAEIERAGNRQAGVPSGAPAAGPAMAGGKLAISPRARNLAEAKGLDPTTLSGSGPGGRIIERDVRAALGASAEMTPAAIAALKAEGGVRPAAGSGIGGRVTSDDVSAARAGGPKEAGAAPRQRGEFPGPTREQPVQGVRRRIAERMHASLQSTAQVTLTMPADARALLAYRARLKAAESDRGLAAVNLNAMVLFAVARSLGSFPEMNAHFLGDKIVQFDRVHLGFAVDTPRGLLVPVIRNADLLSLKEIAAEARRLADACLEGSVGGDDLAGGTFTVSNLGTAGIEYFTPVLNPPQVGIVGVGAVAPRALATDDGYDFVPHMTLSLTIDHQAVDGAPGARFLRALAHNLAAFELLLAG